MEVYIEFVLIENFIIDYILLFSTSILTKFKAKKKRLIISSSFASFSAIFITLINVSGMLLLLTKLMISFLIILLCFYPNKLKNLFLSNIVFLFLTFLVGGICIGISLLTTKIDYGTSGIIWNFEIPLSVIILGLFLFVYLGNQILMHINKKNKISSFFYKIELYYNDILYSTQGYLDSANYIIDKKNNSPVILINENTFNTIFKNNDLNKQKIYQNMWSIQISTLSDKKRQIPCFLLDKLVIYSNSNRYIHKNIVVAISPHQFVQEVNAEVILSPYLFD